MPSKPKPAKGARRDTGFRNRAFISPTSSVAASGDTSAQFLASCTSANQLRTLRLEATLGVTLFTEMPCVSALGFTDNGWPRASCPFALLPPAQACPNPRPAFGPFPASQKTFPPNLLFCEIALPIPWTPTILAKVGGELLLLPHPSSGCINMSRPLVERRDGTRDFRSRNL